MTFVTLKTRASTTMGTNDKLNLSRETKKRPSQRAGKTYSAVQNNLEVV